GHRPERRDERVPVVDRPPRLVAHEVRVDVGDPEGAGPFEHEAAANLVLAEGEVARARVEDDVHRVERQGAAGALDDPGVLTDLEADSDRSAVEAEIAEGVALPRDGQLRALSAGPWLEPARLVVEPVPRQRLLGDEPLQAAISDQADRVVDGLAQPHGETEARHQAPRRRKELL